MCLPAFLPLIDTIGKRNIYSAAFCICLNVLLLCRWDLLTKLNDFINNKKASLHPPSCTITIGRQASTRSPWRNSTKCKNRCLGWWVRRESKEESQLCPGAKAANLKQYPLKRHAKEGIKPLIIISLKFQLIWPCQSPCDTPVLPVGKPGTKEHRFVQGLRTISQIVEDIHSVVPNPYPTLSETYLFTILDLKVAFQCI